MRIIICGCRKSHMEYIIRSFELIARRDRLRLTVSIPDRIERNDDMCRYVTLNERVHTDIGKGMADALIVYKNSAGIRQIENLKHEGRLIFMRDTARAGYGAYSPSSEADEAYMRELLYLKNDAVIIETDSTEPGRFEYRGEEKAFRLLGLR